MDVVRENKRLEDLRRAEVTLTSRRKLEDLRRDERQQIRENARLEEMKQTAISEKLRRAGEQELKARRENPQPKRDKTKKRFVV